MWSILDLGPSLPPVFAQLDGILRVFGRQINHMDSAVRQAAWAQVPTLKLAGYLMVVPFLCLPKCHLDKGGVKKTKPTNQTKKSHHNNNTYFLGLLGELNKIMYIRL